MLQTTSKPEDTQQCAGGAGPAHFGQVSRPTNLTAAAISPCLLIMALIVMDMITIGASGAITYVITGHFRDIDPWQDEYVDHFGVVIVLTCALHLLFFQSAGLYKSSSMRPHAMRALPVFLCWTGVFLLLFYISAAVGISKMLDRNAPHTLEAWYGVGLSALLLNRWLFSKGLREWEAAGRLGRRTLLVGANGLSREWLEHIQQSGDTTFRIVGVIPENDTPRSHVLDVPIVGTIDTLVDQVRRFRIDMVVIAIPWTDEADIRAVVERLRATAVDVYLLPHRLVAQTVGLSVDTAAGVPLLGVSHRPLAGWGAIIKRCEDLTIGVVALIALLPLLLVTAAAIKLESRGPVLFRQKRFGFNNEEFHVLKFRTMYTDLGDQSGARRTTRDDPRVTRVGRFLRRTSIDELPQILNVLRGDMSIVGPRPHPVVMMAGDALYHEAVKDYACRHRVRPGITGWAQVNGLRGEVDNLETAMRRVEYDLYYIDHWSLLLDAKIIAETILVCFRGQNAY